MSSVGREGRHPGLDTTWFRPAACWCGALRPCCHEREVRVRDRGLGKAGSGGHIEPEDLVGGKTSKRPTPRRRVAGRRRCEALTFFDRLIALVHPTMSAVGRIALFPRTMKNPPAACMSRKNCRCSAARLGALLQGEAARQRVERPSSEGVPADDGAGRRRKEFMSYRELSVIEPRRISSRTCCHLWTCGSGCSRCRLHGESASGTTGRSSRSSRGSSSRCLGSTVNEVVDLHADGAGRWSRFSEPLPSEAEPARARVFPRRRLSGPGRRA